MKVLFIAGTGEISYSCLQEAVAKGMAVTVYNRGQNDEPLPQGVERITGSMSDDAAFRSLGDQSWDVVCQYLAYHPDTIQRDIEVFAGKTGQYVFISSASAYCKPPLSHVITEKTPLRNPHWAYSRAKAEMEVILLDAHANGVLPVTIVRPSHTYRRGFPTTIGDGDQIAWRMEQGKPVIVHGDGTSLWTLTHSDEFAVPFVGLLGNGKALGEAFHITSDCVHTWNEIMLEIGATIGFEPKIVCVPTDTLVRINPDWDGPLWGDKSHCAIFDNTKVKSVAGDWSLRIPIKEGFARTASHYRLRRPAFKADDAFHALCDKIAEAQLKVGG